jgi:hypothetical protein
MHWPACPETPEHWLGRNLEVQLGYHDQQFSPPLQAKPAS